MKKLILVRHGKAEKQDDLEELTDDFDRPLRVRAETDAEIIIKAFKLYDHKAIFAISSPAVRALGTAKFFKNGLEIADKNFKIIDDLYTFDTGSLLKVIQEQDDSISQLMVFGHNPAITMLASELGDEDFPNVPTTGMVILDFDAEKWSEIHQGRTLLNLFPKTFKK